jgi:acyl-CoA thioesterase-1
MDKAAYDSYLNSLMTHASPLILAFGDSLIAGYGLSEREGFSAQLEDALRAFDPGAQVLNAGISGNTTADALRRLPRVLSALPRQPDLAVVQVGPNDVMRGLSPQQMRANLEAILTEFNRCTIPVLLATVEPPPFLRHRTGAYIGIHEALARQYGVATCAFFPDDVLGHPDMVLADRVHPNVRAIAVVVQGIVPAIRQLLSERAAFVGS